MDQKLEIVAIAKTTEVEPALYDVVVVMSDKTTTTERMNIFRLQELRMKLGLSPLPS